MLRQLPLAFLLSTLFLSLLAESFTIDLEDLSDETQLKDMHMRWARFYNVTRTEDEMSSRFNVFAENARFIDAFNKKGAPFRLRLNAFGDLTNQEFASTYASYMPQHHAPRNSTLPFSYGDYESLPTSIDWRDQGAVTDVKNQGSCGACWAFAAVAAIEGINQIKRGTLISLSEQELIDCNTVNDGCDGGLAVDGFQFVIDNGVTSESTYPYTGNPSQCQSSSTDVSISGYNEVPPNDENALMQAVANQPIAVRIDPSALQFRFYDEGVFSDGVLTGQCGTNLHHAVTVVGYGVTDQGGVKYWIVKNSWGAEWGENGYIRMARDIDAAEGICGIAMHPTYPSIT